MNTKLSSILFSALILFSSLYYGCAADKQKAQFIQKLEQGEKVKVAALGTSLTGGKWRWFEVMKEWLEESYPGQVEYFNKGVGASASSYPPGKSGLDKAKVLAKEKTDVVFIEFAENESHALRHFLRSCATLGETNNFLDI